MKKILFLFLFIVFQTNCVAQDGSIDQIIPVKTALKVNLNGYKIGIEQRIFKNSTLQFEIGKYIEGKSMTYKPQFRYYWNVFHQNFTYLGLAYFYKQQKTSYNDTLRQLDANGHFTGPRYTKDFSVSKYIHAVTVNTGFLSEERLFNQRIRFEFNIGIGLRFKKSNRYGLLANEELDLKEAFIIRPQDYQDTNGAFKLYPELNLNLSILIPLVK